MFEDYFRRLRVRLRVEENILGPALVSMASEMGRQGYAIVTIQRYVQSAEHFGAWLKASGLPPTAVNPDTVGRFLNEHLPQCSCSTPCGKEVKSVRPALKHLIQTLATIGVVKTEDRRKPTGLLREMQDFDRYLERTCGFAVATRTYRIRYVHEFLVWKFGGKRWSSGKLRPGDFLEFLRVRSEGLCQGTIQVIASSLRSYIKWLVFRGKADERLVRAVPPIRSWRSTRLPKILSVEHEKALLDVFDTSTASGLRDYAIALCLLKLGLRAGEVAAIKLDDIDWVHGTLRIVGRKSCRERILPLSMCVGKSIASYVCKERPATSSRFVFVRHRTPIGKPMVAELVRGAMRRAYAKAGFPVEWTGTHLLRHTAATRMIQAGASLKQIADVLGHQSIDTTVIYTKVDFPALGLVSMPWPGGTS